MMHPTSPPRTLHPSTPTTPQIHLAPSSGVRTSSARTPTSRATPTPSRSRSTARGVTVRHAAVMLTAHLAPAAADIAVLRTAHGAPLATAAGCAILAVQAITRARPTAMLKLLWANRARSTPRAPAARAWASGAAPAARAASAPRATLAERAQPASPDTRSALDPALSPLCLRQEIGAPLPPSAQQELVLAILPMDRTAAQMLPR